MNTSSPRSGPVRSLGTADAVAVGAAAMLGAGVFSVFAPAAEGAGAWLPVAILIAGVLAYCNAVSSARLAARHPESGGAYVYGRERLGDLWGHLAGWAFVVGKTASCAVMALTFAAYLLPGWERPLAAAAVIVLTVVGHRGVRRPPVAVWSLLAVVLATLAAVVAAMLLSGRLAAVAEVDGMGPWPGSFGVLGAAGMVFFAFSGYARVASLGGSVRDPRTTVQRAVTLSIGGVLLLYLVVGTGLLIVLGRERLITSGAPMTDAVLVAGFPWLVPVVAAGAAVACLGALLTLLSDVSRATAVMASRGHLPRPLALRRGRHAVALRAQVLVAAVVIALVLTLDLAAAVSFASFGILVHYTVTNASALRLGPDETRPPLLVPLGGLVGCVVLACSLPLPVVGAGTVVLALGSGLWWLAGRLPSRD
ncbi:APC family permease [Nocardiopsis algeriensis]|uniref:APA family basic amino acid/polyamine antiporter n=1 Tax=Nocardiopsis algeriensis TaxID=1478215 RepID=A0A841IS05_9ACTN|nr:APC family permease [Nocardiopsis algeriensis]MBB6120046.1 APA family basic amino acid/polyamine antiporter [Nocardiopsis algeriensis]